MDVRRTFRKQLASEQRVLLSLGESELASNLEREKAKIIQQAQAMLERTMHDRKVQLTQRLHEESVKAVLLLRQELEATARRNECAALEQFEIVRTGCCSSSNRHTIA